MDVKSKRRIAGFLAAAVVFAADQASKSWAIQYFEDDPHPPVDVLPFLQAKIAWNDGVSYSMLRADTPMGRYALLAVALAISIGLIVWIWRAHNRIASIGLGMIVGGALGNALDRWRFGAVTDFLNFHVPFNMGPFANYVFNVADAGITLGVCLLLYDALFAPKEQSAPPVK